MLRVWPSNFLYSVFYGTLLRVRHQGLNPYPKSLDPNSRSQLRLLDLAVHFTTGGGGAMEEDGEVRAVTQAAETAAEAEALRELLALMAQLAPGSS